MGMSIGELFVSLGFDVDSDKLTSFTDGIKKASEEILKLSAIATGGVLAIGAFMEGSVNRALGFQNFATETGQATEGLQRFQSVVNQVNASVSVEEAGSKYRALANAMRDISQNGGGGSLARLTGGAFHIGMKEEDVIEAIRNYKQTFIAQNANGAAVHAGLLDQIGLGAGSERAFDMPKEQYDAMSNFAVRGQGATDQLTNFASAMALLGQQWDVFKDKLAADWASPLIEAIRKTEAWLIDLGKDIQAIYGWFSGLSPHVREAIEVLAAMGAAAIIWNIPLGGTALALAAIAEAIKDIGNYMRGLPSLTGDLVKGVKTLKSDPNTFANNIWETINQHGGTDISEYIGDFATRQGSQEWTARKNAEALARPEHLLPPITQNVTAHITSTDNAQALVDAFQRENQKRINTTLMSLQGSPVQ